MFGAPCENDRFGPIMYLRDHWTEYDQILTIPHFYENEFADEKKMAFKGQKSHDEVKQTPSNSTKLEF